MSSTCLHNTAFTGRNGAHQSSRPIEGYGSAKLFVMRPHADDLYRLFIVDDLVN